MLWAWGECAQGRGACIEYEVSVHNTDECAWHGISIHKVWGECAQHEHVPSVGECTGCGMIVHGMGECAWGTGVCAQHA